MSNLTQIEKTISILKHPKDFKAIPSLPIKRQGQTVAYMRAVPSEPKGAASNDARLMAEWRNAHKTAFFTWVTSTEESTGRWLKEKYAPNNQDIIFMLETIDHIPFGHVSLYHFQNNGAVCECGRLLRQDGFGPKGGMTICSFVLLLWAAVKLQINTFFLDVFSDNEQAIALYKRIGFLATSTFPLRRTESDGVTRWEKIADCPGSKPTVDGYSIRMELTAKQLFACDSEKIASSLCCFPQE
ncbi:MAG: GNAT family N-acetyltransferase [Candidatus Brocadiae bacterium]|nr:GNAT family N-acetyltransferase [Candidatus Brocadiia bacterium]